ncbi:MAG: dihydropteroate synthase [Acidobacteria bacterium RIFCSPLOWO2_12_FULL_68_19]|nr:MAG: dihydropteroate synthase [Acidobacteria bacterium RIFCSPLOWO2_12_FULL_68_19]
MAVSSRRRLAIPLPNGAALTLGERVLVMGIINVTPDSFSDGGRLLDPAHAIDAGTRMAEEGADLLDVGGESTRPGAEPLEEAEEQRRVLPVVEGLVRTVRVPVSVDTYNASTAEAALAAGAVIVNDISGLRYDPSLARVVAARRAAIVLMHTRGRPRDMYQQASYHDVIGEVLDELRESIAFATAAGIAADRIIVDPGLGFAKATPHSYEVLARLDAFAELGRPLLVGPSRKSFLARPLGGSVPPAERDWATAAAVAAAVLAGAHIVRVHAVREMLQVVRVADEVRRYHA